jgi:hypothetical protein
MKLEIDRLVEQALDFQSQALADVSDIEMTRLEMTMLNNFKQIQTYLKLLSRQLLPDEVQVS